MGKYYLLFILGLFFLSSIDVEAQKDMSGKSGKTSIDRKVNGHQRRDRHDDDKRRRRDNWDEWDNKDGKDGKNGKDGKDGKNNRDGKTGKTDQGKVNWDFLDDDDEGDYDDFGEMDEYQPGVDYVVNDEDVEIPWDEYSYSDAEGLYDVYIPGGAELSEDLKKISKRVGFAVLQSDNVNMYKSVIDWLGTPYKYGGMSKKGVDCSAFVQSVYKTAMNILLSRVSAQMHSKDCNLVAKNVLQEGDLVFFRTDGRRTTTPNHVGLYLKNNKFAHASSSQGVTISDLTTSYYVQTWLTGGHVKVK